MPRKVPDESTNHPDGMNEGVMNDPTGAQIGVTIDPNQIINPKHISEIKKEAIKNQPNDKEQS